VASTIYKRPNDSKIFGSVEIDITSLLDYIKRKRKEGLKITPTHIFVLAAARALRTEVPELNTFVKRGNIVMHDHINVSVSVLLPQGQMSSVKVIDADTLTLAELVDSMSNEIAKARHGLENKTMKIKNVLGLIPWPFRGMLYRLVKTITMKWGLDIPCLGVSANSFGSFMVSNIGSIGLDMGYPALFPSANVSFVLILGGVNRKPWVVNDKIEIRTILSLGAALDHRVVDASHGGILFRYLKQVLRNPEVLETL
jgi:pyruvate/2-oxoglutarate dehydrogenase complex dihydrolipoamide acyltransferase (E2) component